MGNRGSLRPCAYQGGGICGEPRLSHGYCSNHIEAVVARVYHGTSEVDAVASFHPPSVSIGRKMHGKKVHLSTAVGLNYALPAYGRTRYQWGDEPTEVAVHRSTT